MKDENKYNVNYLFKKMSEYDMINRNIVSLSTLVQYANYLRFLWFYHKDDSNIYIINICYAEDKKDRNFYNMFIMSIRSFYTFCKVSAEKSLNQYLNNLYKTNEIDINKYI